MTYKIFRITSVVTIFRRYHTTVPVNTTVKMAQQIYDTNKMAQVRLPKTCRPIHYDLTLEPNFDDFTFKGAVKIDFEQSSPSQNIMLNTNELEISEGYVSDGSSPIPLKTVTYNKEAEITTLSFEKPASTKGSISLNFTGILNDKLKGFYRTALKIDGTEVNAATTQFEATDARRCFPCWDEPEAKATFTVTLIYEENQKADGKTFKRVGLSNMPIVSQTSNDQNKLVVKFDKSPKMSTYLLAFVIGPFEYIEATEGGRPIRVYTPPGKQEQGRYALEVACKSLRYYEDYFDVKYPLPKMDLIAIPDFCSGAMENWGLVTYRESCLLVDPGNTATSTKQWVALVVAHELAHQWFGNLVTMEWWTHLWLNEGFASFMEFLCVDHIFPEYDIWSQFVYDSWNTALNLDSLHNSHPIEVPVNHPSEIEEIFDAISYSKGATVIRMLYQYIGDESFRKGMKEYLTKHAYKNAVTEDLWISLSASSGKPVTELMSGWTSQKGYPWLDVVHTQESDKVKLSLTQSKFTADGTMPESDAKTTWMVPISAVTGKDPKTPVELCLMNVKTTTVELEGVANTWVKLNPGTIGLYRTAYPKEMRERLYHAIAEKTLSAMDRLGIQNDLFALCQAGKASTVDLLTLLQSFKSETDYTVWTSIDGCIAKLSNIINNTDYNDSFKAYGRQIYTNIFEKLTWQPSENDKHTDSMTRALVISRLAGFDDPRIIEESLRKFRSNETIPADLRGAIYKVVSNHGSDADFDKLFVMYESTHLNEEQNRLGRAIGSTKNPARIKRAIDFIFSDTVRNQDKIYPMMAMGAASPDVAFNVLKDKKDFIREKYGTNHLMTGFVKACCQNFVTEEKAQEVSKFFEENKFPGAERTINQALENIRLNAAWLGRDSSNVKAYLSQL